MKKKKVIMRVIQPLVSCILLVLVIVFSVFGVFFFWFLFFFSFYFFYCNNFLPDMIFALLFIFEYSFIEFKKISNQYFLTQNKKGSSLFFGGITATSLPLVSTGFFLILCVFRAVFMFLYPKGFFSSSHTRIFLYPHKKIHKNQFHERKQLF